MRSFRWWLGQKLFHTSCWIMPADERTVMIRLLKLGTNALRDELESASPQSGAEEG